MTGFLPYAVILLGLIILIGFFNEKKTKLTYEIALMLIAAILGGLVCVADLLIKNQTISDILYDIQMFDLEDFLMKGVLCFMLFAGSCHMNLADFKRLARPIGVLSILCTLLGAVFYGGLFYGVACLFHLPFNLPTCLMFGSIVSPTDPIAATSILNRFGLSKDICFVIEGESLLNDGVGVALFVCFSGMVRAQQNAAESFFIVLFRELFGAALIGAVVTILCFWLVTRTSDQKRRIYASLFAVALSYTLCEVFDCSGAIASVVCGVLFATFSEREKEKKGSFDLEEFDSFWDIVDNLLNSVLYVIMGLSFTRILQMPSVILLSLAAIVCNLLARGGSVFCSTFFMGDLPDSYDRKSFTELFTWAGLKGGLCIALAMSTTSMMSTEDYHIVLGCTYAIVFFTTILQGLSIKKVYAAITAKMQNK